MHVAREYAFLSAADARTCGVPLERLGNPDEVGLLFVEDSETGEHFTTVGDANTVRMLKEACEAGVMAATTLPGLPFIRQGWPDEWV